jgi:hypothetical protein
LLCFLPLSLWIDEIDFWLPELYQNKTNVAIIMGLYFLTKKSSSGKLAPI